MLRIRYMIVDHSAEHDDKLAVDSTTGHFTHVPPMHELCPMHHWERMDSNTIFVKAQYPARHQDALFKMSGVTMLPATFSRKTVASAIDEQKNPQHHTALKNHAVPYDPATTTTSDLVDWYAEHVAPAFDHEQ